MTSKREEILYSSLELFAQYGFNNTPTSVIARKANVSEGLIFKHYTNKDGLLQAVLNLGREQSALIYAEVFKIQDPLEKIKAIIALPFEITKDHHPFWKLVYSLKWQSDMYDDSMSSPIKEQLITAFRNLNATDPYLEADTVLMLVDGAATHVLLRKTEENNYLKNSLLDKYDKLFMT